MSWLRQKSLTAYRAGQGARELLEDCQRYAAPFSGGLDREEIVAGALSECHSVLDSDEGFEEVKLSLQRAIDRVRKRLYRDSRKLHGALGELTVDAVDPRADAAFTEVIESEHRVEVAQRVRAVLVSALEALKTKERDLVVQTFNELQRMGFVCNDDREFATEEARQKAVRRAVRKFREKTIDHARRLYREATDYDRCVYRDILARIATPRVYKKSS